MMKSQERKVRQQEYIEKHALQDLMSFCVMMLLYERPDDASGYCAQLISDIQAGKFEEGLPLFTEDEIKEAYRQYILPGVTEIPRYQARECLESMGVPKYICERCITGDGTIGQEEFTESAKTGLRERVRQWVD